jgi:micrococcal nuclease
VIDGDTVEMADGDRCRLLGIDTPERGEDGFDEATDFLRELIEGKRVRLEADPDHDDRDFFGRLLRHVYLPDDRNVQVLIIEAGHSRYETRWGRSKVLEALLPE